MEDIFESPIFSHNKLATKWAIPHISTSEIYIEVVSEDIVVDSKGLSKTEMKPKAGRQINLIETNFAQWESKRKLVKMMMIKTAKQPKKDVCQLECVFEEVQVNKNQVLKEEKLREEIR